ncbi:MAG TPA: cupin domain-containing protein [Sediminibacterium sp.]
MKKIRITLTVAIISFAALAQAQPVASDVFTWKNDRPATGTNSVQKMFRGSGAVLSFHLMTTHILDGESMLKVWPSDTEDFYIIKEGAVSVKLNSNNLVVLGKGSVICLMPDDSLTIQPSGGRAELYQMSYHSIAPPDAQRGRNAGGSFLIDWNAITFKPHDKGGVRQFFDRPTAMLHRFDIHVTTLNPNNKSHDPHTHKNEEIIVMLQGNAEMQIGTEHKKANGGDVVYLGSNVLHNLTNIGTVPCVYYAIQWN